MYNCIPTVTGNGTPITSLLSVSKKGVAGDSGSCLDNQHGQLHGMNAQQSAPVFPSTTLAKIIIPEL